MANYLMQLLARINGNEEGQGIYIGAGTLIVVLLIVIILVLLL